MIEIKKGSEPKELFRIQKTKNFSSYADMPTNVKKGSNQKFTFRTGTSLCLLYEPN